MNINAVCTCGVCLFVFLFLLLRSLCSLSTVFCCLSHLLLVRWRGAGRRSLSLRRLWNTTDAAHSLRDWTQRAVNRWGRLLGFGLSCSVYCEEEERGRRGGSSDVWMQRAWTLKKALNRSSYITAVNQRWSGGGNIWQMKMRARLSPPTEKDPSSLLCTMRLSMCSVTGEGSESGLSRGSSSCRRHSTCCWDWVYQRKNEGNG